MIQQVCFDKEELDKLLHEGRLKWGSKITPSNVIRARLGLKLKFKGRCKKKRILIEDEDSKSSAW